ncbi:FAD-dependent oxidoreductase [Mesorhizobium sp. 1M-11]|uniref:FAD-dependent oxidoreductase n=1 Tax=Mesorhizobium sp. 1M-11 TaxID=1529006 RepID=UPI0006C76393|nr:FAD-dependent oxidoreductase [Mesorhizobium sp. 1M-11]
MADTFPSVTRPQRPIRILREVDVAVIGGGAAGVAAAVSAARNGASVLLLEKNGYLGGTMTTATLGGICGLYSLVDGEPVQMVFGLAEEVRQRLVAARATTGPYKWLRTASLPYDVTILKSIFDDMTACKGLEVIFHADLSDVVLEEDGRVAVIILRSRGMSFAVGARSFIDCTGDAELCSLAGGRTEFDPRHLQYPSAMFRMGGVDTLRIRQTTREELREHLERAVKDGFDLPRTSGGVYSVQDGVVHLNITKVGLEGHPPDPFDPVEMSQAEREGRRQAQLYLEAFRRYVPGYRRAYILDIGAELGIRESRRIRGGYLVSGEDVLSERRFEDAVAVNCWPVEDHGDGRSTNWQWLSPGGYCQIPFRSLLPEGLPNVIVAGRCVSATRQAQAAIRVTANCFSMGQAAGTAAAIARGSPFDPSMAQRVKAVLEKQGAVMTPLV